MMLIVGVGVLEDATGPIIGRREILKGHRGVFRANNPRRPAVLVAALLEWTVAIFSAL
jgi:hypothetical protein